MLWFWDMWTTEILCKQSYLHKDVIRTIYVSLEAYIFFYKLLHWDECFHTIWDSSPWPPGITNNPRLQTSHNVQDGYGSKTKPLATYLYKKNLLHSTCKHHPMKMSNMGSLDPFKSYVATRNPCHELLHSIPGATWEPCTYLLPRFPSSYKLVCGKGENKRDKERARQWDLAFSLSLSLFSAKER